MTSTRFIRKYPRMLLGAGLVSALALAGCAPSSGGGGASTTDSSDAPVSTDVEAAGEVTLNLTDYWGGVEGEWIEQVIEQFEAKYSNVTIAREQQDWNQMNSTLNLRLQEDSSPDIATANKGWESLGTISEAGLVVNLDQYAEAYGWDERVPDTLQRQYKFNDTFTSMGVGSWFATPVARTQLVGLYYNIEKLESLGIGNPPTTLAELESAAAVARDAGETAFMNGSQSSSQVPLFGVQALFADSDDYNGFVYGETSVTAVDSGVEQAFETVNEWASEGFFPDGYEGLDHDTGGARFLAGEGLFRWDYTGSLDPDDDTAFGYVQLTGDRGTAVTMGTTPATMIISARCEHPDVAAAFLDYLMSDDAAQAAADLGLVPALSDQVAADAENVLLSTQIAASEAINANDGYLPFFDWTTSTMLDTVTQNLQSLYAGRTSVDAAVNAVDADRDAFWAER